MPCHDKYFDAWGLASLVPGKERENVNQADG